MATFMVSLARTFLVEIETQIGFHIIGVEIDFLNKIFQDHCSEAKNNRTSF